MFRLAFIKLRMLEVDWWINHQKIDRWHEQLINREKVQRTPTYSFEILHEYGTINNYEFIMMCDVRCFRSFVSVIIIM